MVSILAPKMGLWGKSLSKDAPGCLGTDILGRHLERHDQNLFHLFLLHHCRASLETLVVSEPPPYPKGYRIESLRPTWKKATERTYGTVKTYC